MADNNIDIQQLQEALDALTATLNGTSSSLSNSMTPLEREMKAQKEALEKYKAALKKAQDEQYASWSKVSGAMTGFTKSAMDNGGSFKMLNTAVDLSVKVIGGLASAIPVVGGAFKALGEAAGDVTKMMIDQFQTGWNAYKDLQDTGLVKSFEDLKDTSLSTGLMFQDITKSLGKYSTDMANFGGSVGGGMKAFKNMATALEPVRRNFNALGIGAAEFNEFQAKYLAQETRLGRAKEKNDSQLQQGTKDYIEQLDTLSKLTGLSRKDLQAQRDAALSETKFGAAMSEMTEKTQDSFHNLNAYMTSKGGPALAQGLRDLTSGAVSSDAAKQLMLATGGNAAEVIEKLKSGAITSEQAFEEMRKSMDPKKMAEYAKYVGDGSLAAKDFAQVQKMANSTAPTAQDIKNIEDERNKNLTGANRETKALANTEQQLYDTSKNLQNLMTSSTIVTKGMDSMSDALDELSIKMLEMSGGAIPEDLKARKEERKAIKELNDAKEKEAAAAKEAQTGGLEMNWETGQFEINDRLAKEQKEKLAKAREATSAAEKKAGAATENRKKISGATAKETRAAAEGNQPSSSPEATGGTKPKSSGGRASSTSDPRSLTAVKPEDVLEFGNQSGDKGHFDQIVPDLKDKVLSAAQSYFEQTGKKLKINSAVRDKEEQQKLWDESVKLGTPGIGPSGMLVSKPGTSKHELGNAVDIQQGKGDKQAIDALTQAGLKQPFPDKDPVHFEISARDGFDGVLDGPETGYKPDVTMHGKEQMTITPEKSKNDELLAAMIQRLDTMIEKYDEVITLLDDGNNHSKKLVTALA